MKRLRALALFLALALLLLAPGLGPDKVPGEGVDLSGTLWFYDWTRRCLTTFTSPNFTRDFFWPDGMDVLATTGDNLLDAILALPLRWLLGSPAYLGAFLAVVLVGNGLCAWSLALSLGASEATALAAGVLLTMHPYVIHEISQGRPTQALLWFPILAVQALISLVDEPRLRTTFLAGLWLSLAGWTWWFHAHLLAACFGPALLVLVLDHGRRDSAAGWRAILALATAGCVALALVAPALMAVLDHQAIPGVGLAAVGDPAAAPFAAWWVLAPSTSSLHLPVWRWAFLATAVLLSRRPLAWGVALGFGSLLAAGPHLLLRASEVPNPAWALAGQILPFFERFWFPYRTWSALAVLETVVVAEAADRLLSRLPVGRAPAALAAALVIAQAWTPLTRPLPATSLSTPTWVTRVAAEPGLVLDLPYLCAGARVHLQSLHHQPLVGGMAEENPIFRPPGVEARIRANPLLSAVADASRGGGLPVGIPRATPSEVRWIVLHGDLYPTLDRIPGCWVGAEPPRAGLCRVYANLVTLLGPATLTEGSTTAWSIRSP